MVIGKHWAVPEKPAAHVDFGVFVESGNGLFESIAHPKSLKQKPFLPGYFT